MQKFYLVRHGMPQMPYGERYDIVPGPFLSEEGREQAGRTGRFLAREKVTQLYHSPLARAVETAAILAKHVSLPSQEVADLAEWRREETAELVRERVARFWETIVYGENGRVALVTHGGPIEQLLKHLSRDGIDLSGHVYWGRASTPPAGVWLVEAMEGGEGWRMEMVFDPGAFV
jgi:broad specificity phosphatase PhoE